MPYGILAGAFDPATGMRTERVLSGNSVATAQDPTGTGEANGIKVEFGPAVNDANDYIQLLADGTMRCNIDGMYNLHLSLFYGRDAGSQEAELRLRGFSAGIGQIGVTIGTTLGSSKATIPFTNSVWLNLTAGAEVYYEIMRDSSGVDAGGLRQAVVTPATAPNWNDAACAALRIDRLVQT